MTIFMNFNQLFYKQPPLVVANSTTHSWLLQFKRGKKQDESVTLTDFAGLPLPDDLYVGDKMKDYAAWGALLKQAVEKAGLSGRSVLFALPYAMVRTHQLRLPAGLRSQDVTLAIQSQMQWDMRTAGAAFCIDYVETPTADAAYQTYLYAAAHHELVTHYLAALENAGLQVKLLDIDLYAYVRAVLYLAKNFQDQLKETPDFFAILHIDTTMCRLILIQAQQIRFTALWAKTDLYTDFQSAKEKIMRECDGEFDHASKQIALDCWMLCDESCDEADDTGFLQKITTPIACPVFSLDRTFNRFISSAQLKKLPLFTAYVSLGLALQSNQYDRI